MASNMSSVSTAAEKEKGPRAMHIVELPAELLCKILGFLSFKNLSQCRLVSRYGGNEKNARVLSGGDR